ncbi:MAG: acyltransferase [Planctomycetes bacterium]|nr:acyltransferase [Planctomycetota bacterium]
MSQEHSPSMATAAPTQHVHYPVLDGLRGVAIALVMFQHFFQRTPKGTAFVDDVVFGLAGRSWMGVDVFFVLSGFLITGILWDSKGHAGYFRKFYARRILRIFPAYYLVLFLAYVVLPRLGSPPVDAYLRDSLPDQAWHWTYLSNLKIALRGAWYEHHIPNVFWSLAIEEQFYMVWPLVVWGLAKRSLMTLCTVLFFVALGLRVYLAIDPDVNWIQSFVLTPSRMDGLVLGAFLALLFRMPQGQAPKVRWQIGLVGVLATALVGAMTLYTPEGWREQPLFALRFTGIALASGAVLWLALTGQPGSIWVRIFSQRWLRFLGKYSYALYLWHGPADALVRHSFQPTALVGGSRLPAQLAFVLAAFGVALLAALASWHLVEKHCLRLKRRFA